jgi:hypothetical protein
MKNKVLAWLFAAFVVYFIVKNPHGAVGLAHGLGRALGAAGDGLGVFFVELTKSL